MDGHESLHFKNGLTINYDSEVDVEYIDDRKKINSQHDLNRFILKWGDFFPEIKADLSFNVFNKISKDKELQAKIVNNGGFLLKYTEVLLPKSLLRYWNLACHFQVTTGVVILQLHNSEKNHVC